MGRMEGILVEKVNFFRSRALRPGCPVRSLVYYRILYDGISIFASLG